MQFDGELIGPGGRAGLAVQPAFQPGAPGRSAAPTVNVNAGSAVAPDRAVVAVDSNALASSGLAAAASGLNVIGGNGLNSALLKNVNALKKL
jgi:hypothetical protein